MMVWYDEDMHSLNPCFSGRYAGRRACGLLAAHKNLVLILVFREDMLGVVSHNTVMESEPDVLILVFREDMLGVLPKRTIKRLD